VKSKIVALALTLAFCCSASAQNYPTRTITMIVPFAAGGPTDLLGRLLAQRMGEILGQTVIVENLTGAGGMTGMKRMPSPTATRSESAP
jgi:tripartite-type tricarboxylate transporter receptor subunit TctC